MRCHWRCLCALLSISSSTLAAQPHRPVPIVPLIARSNEDSSRDIILLRAEQVAASFGIVTSTLRSVAHNRAVGGVPNSYHLLGRAVDVVRRAGVSHKQVADALRAAGYVLIESLDEGTHSHFAFAGPAPRQTVVQTAERVIRSPLIADEHGSLIPDVEMQRKIPGTSDVALAGQAKEAR